MSDIEPRCAILIAGEDATLYSVRTLPRPDDTMSKYMYADGFVQVYSTAMIDPDGPPTFYNPRWIKKELLFFIK